MLDHHNNEMKSLHEMAYDQVNQTVLQRFESAIRLLKVHGLLTDREATNAWGKLQELKLRDMEKGE